MRKTLTNFLLVCVVFNLNTATVGAKPTKAQQARENCLAKIKTNTTFPVVVVECEWVDLRGAQLRGAFMYGIKLRGATLRRAILVGANLRHAELVATNLFRAELAGANLRHANLNYANLREANLLGANLTDANLTGAYLGGALYNNETIWPKGFDPKTAGAVFYRY